MHYHPFSICLLLGGMSSSSEAIKYTGCLKNQRQARNVDCASYECSLKKIAMYYGVRNSAIFFL